jgi:hypothetical protein
MTMINYLQNYQISAKRSCNTEIADHLLATIFNTWQRIGEVFIKQYASQII